MNWKKKDAHAAALFAVILMVCACTEKRPPRPEQLRVTVEGMHCETCAEGITEALVHTRGVLATDVHFSNRVQTIDYDADRLSPGQLVAVITNRGFQAKPVAIEAPKSTATSRI